MKALIFLLILGVTTHLGRAESQSTQLSSGVSLSAGGVQFETPRGGGLGLSFDGRFLSSEISLTGSKPTGGQAPVSPLPQRLLPPIDSSLGNRLSDPNDFFKGIGKQPGETPYRRPSTK